jgi:hypothetical protein
VAERCEQRCREKTALWSRFDETAAAALHRLHTGGVTLAVVSNCVARRCGSAMIVGPILSALHLATVTWNIGPRPRIPIPAP